MNLFYCVIIYLNFDLMVHMSIYVYDDFYDYDNDDNDDDVDDALLQPSPARR